MPVKSTTVSLGASSVLILGALWFFIWPKTLQHPLPKEPKTVHHRLAVHPKPVDPGTVHLPTPAVVRGIYLTGWTAGNPATLVKSVYYLKQYGLNTMVIDVKDDDGRLSFALPGTLAENLGANDHKIANPKAVLSYLHSQGIYVIGRLVTFCDPYLSHLKPDLGIQQNGQLWLDNRGLSWTDPTQTWVEDYNIQIAVAAAHLGFDEIQFDYVRFPAAPWVATTTSQGTRTTAITTFLQKAAVALHKEKVPLSADVFGLTTIAHSDMGIGQLYSPLAPVVNYISPMLYPSLYAPYTFGEANPNADPFRTIYKSLLGATVKVQGEKGTHTRPWIQDYNLGYPPYHAPEVDQEFQALAAAGVSSFLLWNPANVYSPGINPSLANVAKVVYSAPTTVRR